MKKKLFGSVSKQIIINYGMVVFFCMCKARFYTLYNTKAEQKTRHLPSLDNRIWGQKGEARGELN